MGPEHWGIACDESFNLPLLGLYHGFWVGALPPNSYIPKDTMSQEELSALSLPKKFKLWLAYSLSGPWQVQVILVRPGGGTEEEETKLNARIFGFAHQLDHNFLTWSADGSSKERLVLRSQLLRAWNDVHQNPVLHWDALWPPWASLTVIMSTRSA